MLKQHWFWVYRHLFSFDVVKCEEKYGIIFEHLRNKTQGRQIMDDQEHLEHYQHLYADTLKEIHQIKVPRIVFCVPKKLFLKKILWRWELY